MKWFPEMEKRKRFMKSGLPVIFTVAWTPVVGMLLAMLLGPPMQKIFVSGLPVMLVIGVLTLIVMLVLYRLFRQIGLKIFDQNA
jgi:membrane protease YdiL (CAAX protease family)